METLAKFNVADAEGRAAALRRLHPRFTYEAFRIEPLADALRLTFNFLFAPEIRFEPEITIRPNRPLDLTGVDRRLLERCVFHLGLIEMLSYWKAACSREIVVLPGSLSPAQIDWHLDLLLHGMGEFFYVNRIDFKQPGFVRISAAAPGADDLGPGKAARLRRPLVLASGGKDTAVSLQLLRESGSSFDCLMLNPTQAALDLGATAGQTHPIIVTRQIDPRLLALNREGWLNGHTPFSAYLAVLGVTCAVLFGHDEVIVSNERSSNEGNVDFLGSSINHQYSKTFRFEKSFQDYARAHLVSDIAYFSLLRPLYEIQILRLFSSYPRYFQSFRSCNRNQTQNSWCGQCPKCVSMFTLFYPFLEPEDLTRIFGKNLFADEAPIPMLRKLSGLDEHKPFECVGTVDETIAALHLGVERDAARAGGILPAVLRYAREQLLPLYPQKAELARSILTAWGEEHQLPDAYVAMLKRSLGD